MMALQKFDLLLCSVLFRCAIFSDTTGFFYDKQRTGKPQD